MMDGYFQDHLENTGVVTESDESEDMLFQAYDDDSHPFELFTTKKLTTMEKSLTRSILLSALTFYILMIAGTQVIQILINPQ